MSSRTEWRKGLPTTFAVKGPEPGAPGASTQRIGLGKRTSSNLFS